MTRFALDVDVVGEIHRRQFVLDAAHGCFSMLLRRLCSCVGVGVSQDPRYDLLSIAPFYGV